VLQLFGAVVSLDVVWIALEYLQISGLAFTTAVPWSQGKAFAPQMVKLLKYITLDIWPQGWTVSFGMKLFTITAFWVVEEIIFRKFKRSAFHPSSGSGQDHQHELLTVVRRTVEKVRSYMLTLLVIPCVHKQSALANCFSYLDPV